MSTKKLQVLDYRIKYAENSDTLDGKHASDFASATDMETAQSNISDLKTKVGDTSVSAQITNAISSAIPSVTAADNGKFMTVINGAWAVEAVPNAEEASF